MVGAGTATNPEQLFAAGYAACHFVTALGTGEVHEALREVIALHDRESRALQGDLGLA